MRSFSVSDRALWVPQNEITSDSEAIADARNVAQRLDGLLMKNSGMM